MNDRQRLVDHLARTLVRPNAGLEIEHDWTPPNEDLAIIGDYRVLRLVGQGSMGQVFKAEHVRMNRIVALKLISDCDDDSAETLARFRREIEAVSQLDHPNVVTVYDARIANGGAYLVMEYIDGHDLQTLVERDGALSLDGAVNYVLQAARGLAHAHQHGIVHRDVKPSNLIVDSAGTVKVLDLGVARFEESCPCRKSIRHLTRAGQVIGTVAFMAPEQAIDSRSVDQRADVYGLGCTLYYLLTTRLPCVGSTPSETAAAHQSQAMPSLRRFRPDVSPRLQSTFARAVAKDVRRRYTSMEEFARDLILCRPDGETISSASQGWATLSTDAPLPSSQSAGSLGWSREPRFRKARSTTPVRPCESRRFASKRLRRYAGIAAACCVAVALTLVLATREDATRTPDVSHNTAQRTVRDNELPIERMTPTFQSESSNHTRELLECSIRLLGSVKKSISNWFRGSLEASDGIAIEHRLNNPPDIPTNATARVATPPDATDVHSESPDPVRFQLAIIAGKRIERLSDLTAAEKRLAEFVAARNRASEAGRRSLPFVAELSVNDHLFHIDSPAKALKVCHILSTLAASDDGPEKLISTLAGPPHDVARSSQAAQAYIRQTFPQMLDQWLEEKDRVPDTGDVRRILMKTVAAGKTDKVISRAFDASFTPTQLNNLVGDVVEHKTEAYRREKLQQDQLRVSQISLLNRRPLPPPRPPHPPRR